MGYVSLGDVDLRVTGISQDSQIKTSIKYLQGANGSHTKRIGTGGRLITLPVTANKHEITDILALKDKTGPLILTSQSWADYNGEYHIIELTPTEDRPGHWQITIKLQEHIVFNAKRMDFTSFEINNENTGVEIDVNTLWTV